MNDSQSSDVFSDISCESPEMMAEATYETLVRDTKLLLSKDIKQEMQGTSGIEYFSSAINSCRTCVSQSLDQVISLLSEAEQPLEVNISKICEFLEDAVNVLHLLCAFITSAVELVSMTCGKMRTFPTCTGKIILTVFTHCKDSESIYGLHLSSFEKQLKDMFRNCHELQLTYLMVLEKNFIFDLTVQEDLDVLLEALEINLQIGEIVQSLDVKTMAEQWKAYTVICEKYSDSLKDGQIYENCSKVLCTMIENNINIAMEGNQQDKISIRSLKVASFTIKILLRVCNIFRQANDKNHHHILDLLLHIFLNNLSYLELCKKNSPQCLSSINSLVFNPTETLLKDLLQDDNFVISLSKLRIENLKDEKQLSYILLIISAAKCYTVPGNVPINAKKTIIEFIFKWLPYGHIWFNIGLKFKNGEATFGLYEHLLTHTFALTCTFNSEEIGYVEKIMYESILGLECYSALFATNLWELLAKTCPRQFVYNQILSLSQIYKRIENNKMFAKSPQKVHLEKLIGRLFQTLHGEDKMNFYRLQKYDVNHENNFSLWTAIRLESLGSESTYYVNEQIEFDIKCKLQEMFQKVLKGAANSIKNVEFTISLMKLLATGLNVEPDISLQNDVIQAWLNLCPKSNKQLYGPLNQDSVWYLEYIEALVSLTQDLKYIFLESGCVVKILHVIENMIDTGPVELKLVLINLLNRTLQFSYTEDENEDLIQEIHMKILHKLLQDNNKIVKSKIYYELMKQKDNKQFRKNISQLNQDDSLRKSLKIVTQLGNSKMLEIKGQLSSTIHFNYNHKCLEKCIANEAIALSDSGTLKSNSNASNNFDFVDMDTLFENESDSEPACKRVKLNSNEAEEIIRRLEKDTSLLCNVKENVISSEYKIRIRDVCEKLLNIID